GVPVGRVVVRLRVLGRTVDGRVNVAPTSDDDTVEHCYGRFGLRHVATRWEQDRTAPVVPDGRHVRPRQQGTFLRPATPVGVRVVRGDANSRRHLSPSW